MVPSIRNFSDLSKNQPVHWNLAFPPRPARALYSASQRRALYIIQPDLKGVMANVLQEREILRDDRLTSGAAMKHSTPLRAKP